MLSRYSYAAYSNIQDCRVVSKVGEEECSNCLLYLSVLMAVPSIQLSRDVGHLDCSAVSLNPNS